MVQTLRAYHLYQRSHTRTLGSFAPQLCISDIGNFKWQINEQITRKQAILWLSSLDNYSSKSMTFKIKPS